MKADKKMYMIRRRKDGLYSTGGMYPWFTTNGKMWSSMRSLNGHLSSIYSNQLSRGADGKKSILSIEAFADMHDNPYYECDVVEVVIQPTLFKDVLSHLALRYQKEEPQTAGVMET